VKNDFDLTPGLREYLRPAFKDGTLLPLLQRRCIYLTDDGGDSPRFARLFQETWKRIPLGARRRMLAYWRTGRNYGHILSPTVELASYQFRGRRDYAAVDHCGHRLRFRAKFFDRMSEDVVQDVIAHELAHVLQSAGGIRCVREWADGRAHYVFSDGTDFGGNRDLEEDADFTIDCWGFDPEAVDRWALETGIRRVVYFDDPRKCVAAIQARLDRVGR
jgi:hypothetical protein